MKEIKELKVENELEQKLKKEIAVSVRLGDLLQLYSIYATTSTEDIKKAINDTQGVNSDVVEFVGKGKDFDDFKLYKQMQEILKNYGLVSK